jgi:hypothetical protein
MPTQREFRASSYNKLAFALFALVVITIGVQVARVGGQTQTEAALFNILQFSLSLTASVLLARASIGKEYHDRQRTLALSAFRRIREIELSLDRLTWYISQKMESRGGSDCGELETIGQSVLGLKASTNSALRDWSDIIGDQIEKIERMEELEKQRISLLSESYSELPHATINGLSRTRRAMLEIDSELASLEGEVPVSLRVQEDGNELRNRYLKTAEIELRMELERIGSVKLNGIWHPNESFDRSPAELRQGESLRVSVGDAGARIGALIVYDSVERSVGVIVNSLGVPMPYRDFVEALTGMVGSSRFSVTLEEVSSVVDEKGRTRLTVSWSSRESAKMAARA